MNNKIKSKFFQLISFDRKLLEAASVINIQRMYLLSWIMGAINIVHIAFFGLNVPSSPQHVVLWYHSIITLHLTMLLANMILGLIAFKIKKQEKEGEKKAYLMQTMSIFLNLLFGILLCVSDQLVTTNINPLLTACIGVGLIFLIPPIIAVVVYAATFFLFFYMVTWTQHVPELLIHIRINSVTATGMGLGISLILWKNHLSKLKQNHVIQEQQRNLEEKNESLQFLATRDALTGLFNRMHFIELANTEAIKNGKTNQEACIIILDIDFFKKVNDDFGHPAGDQILKELSDIIQATLKITDISARLGGEEFIILLPQTGLQLGKEIAEQLRQTIEAHSFSYEGKTIKVTASFGIAKLSHSFHTCYNDADKALYMAKQTGRNRVMAAESQSARNGASTTEPL
ncbi:diguanylate cyclase domain protein [Anoxybacillus sp. B7M1]|uniref:GGDEF domain-containing protein n=1 Tax=Anoxybacteroides rupiense TaxID=311460 RepID=A0ABT5W2S4_9BACL|nr:MULTISPECIES: GGDEF domain-containing protein [Anoxybacillus]ANB58513.1 diguanylate cyclase domain protein [Anoxybacillus sp. B2M1]ANB65497.1 diguanylate cyclase domain protein [Anoxybacillus sp. B7M1]KXG09717.1 putative diguanylate cyclase YedQ [Anoxybacillus sp. P3H1B]MBS2770862.1 GGDEF domain-containing protein [Anoxybacillus rupiensis]MDE8563626.1 GGDEF domain-containing protein [Anoxybacillus rupiensis]